MGMLLEAVLYAILLAVLISTFLANTFQLIPPTAVEELPVLQQIALSLGAGLYEELFFRVFLIFVLFRIFKFIFSKKLQSYAAAVLVGALIFSLAHYTGSLGDPFTLGSFLFRFLFGVALNVIYVTRGFGVTAWTHAFYDIMVVAFL
jgi:membrane protease YdiL (CAAX protease family)